MRLAVFAITLGLVTVPLAAADAARGDARAAASGPAGRLAAPASSALDRPRPPQRGSAAFSAPISCVPYARAVTGLDIRGNGRDWWHAAAGRYPRSQRPAEGAVLSFPGTRSMPMGHVAVVSRVVHPRLIEIDHANWGGPGIRRGMVMRDVRVVDVSADNSWTRVRVQVGWDRDTFGREYPTYGFIHNRSAGAYAEAEQGALLQGPLLHRAVATTTRVEAAPPRRTVSQQRPAVRPPPRVAQAAWR